MLRVIMRHLATDVCGRNGRGYMNIMDLANALDTGMDRSIALGYGNVGLLIRRRLPGWPADPPPMNGRLVVVTGAASGLGLAAAQGFAELGADVVGVVRNQARARDLDEIVSRDFGSAGAHVTSMVCDVSSVRSIRDFAGRLGEHSGRVDVLVNNAGVMPDERQESEDGVELTFATHVLGPYVLAHALAGMLHNGGRVINVTSGGMYSQRLPADDLQTERADYHSTKVYAQTKRAQMIVTEQLAESLGGRGIIVHAMHPGWADTPGVRQWLPVFRVITRPIIRTPKQGADTIVWLGGAPEAAQSTGRLWQDRVQRPTHYLSRTRESDEDRETLLAAVTELAGAQSTATER